MATPWLTTLIMARWHGAKLGVLVMVAVTLAVQGAFVGFFLYLRKRAKRIAEADLETEWSQLQGASRTS